MSSLLRVALIDSDDYVREGRVLLLNSQLTLQIVFESGDPSHALEVVGDYLLDVLIVDARIPGWKTHEFLSELTTRLETAGNDSQVITLTSFVSAELELACLRAGAAEVISVEQGVPELLSKIRLLGSGENTISRAHLEQLIGKSKDKFAPNSDVALSLNELDASQLSVLKAMLAGQSDTQIARELELTRYRVAKFIESLRIRSGFRTRQQLAIELLGFGEL